MCEVRAARRGILYLLPRGDLLVGPDAGGVKAVAGSFVGDKSRLADDQRSRYICTHGVVLDDEICGCVLAVPPKSGQGRHNHSMLEGGRADLNGLKKFGCGHCKASGCLEDYWAVMYSRIKPSFIQQFPDANGHDWVAKRSLLD